MAHADDVIAGLDEVIEAPSAPEPEVKVDPPADKEPPARAEDGKFKGKEGEKKPESKPEDKPAEVKAPEAKPEPKTIPLAAYMEDKKTWQQKIADLEAKLNAVANPPKAAAVPAAPPAYEENPKGYLDAKVDSATAKVDSAIQKLESGVQPIQKSVEQLRADLDFNQFMGTVQATQDQFLQQQPDYFDALNFIRHQRTTELSMAMPHLTPEQVQQAITQEEVGLARVLLQQGRNPHAVAYQIAQTRGYKQAAAAVPPPPDVPKPNQLSPDLTLGSSAGQSDVEDGEEDPIDIALKSVWRPQKRA